MNNTRKIGAFLSIFSLVMAGVFWLMISSQSDWAYAAFEQTDAAIAGNRKGHPYSVENRSDINPAMRLPGDHLPVRKGRYSFNAYGTLDTSSFGPLFSFSKGMLFYVSPAMLALGMILVFFGRSKQVL
jgi:hypothetical protein